MSGFLLLFFISMVGLQFVRTPSEYGYFGSGRGRVWHHFAAQKTLTDDGGESVVTKTLQYLERASMPVDKSLPSSML